MIDPNVAVTYEDLVNSYANTHCRSEYSKVFEAARQATSAMDKTRNQSIKFLRQVSLFECLRSVLRDGIAGDIAECGCFRGQASYLIATTMQKHERGGELHLFDSFSGLSEFADEDNAGLARDKDKTDQMRSHFAFPEVKLRQNLSGFPFVRVYAGWIPERFSEVADRQFALVHIDVDLYRPTRDSLEFFYPRLSLGGWIVVDDYNARNFPGANAAVDGFLETTRPTCAVPGQAGGLIIQK